MSYFFTGVFFKFYQWFKRLDLDNVPEYSAISGVTILQSFNLLALIIGSNYLFKGSTKLSISVIVFVVLGLIIWLTNYMYFIRKRRYVKIFKEYSKSMWSKSTGGVITLSYIVITILVLFLLNRAA